MSKNKINEEIKNLQTQLAIEKAEDLSQFKIKMQSTTLIERRNEGVLWYPVQLATSLYDAGERLIINVSRSKEHSGSHLFQNGKLVSIFSNSDSNNEQTTFVTGVVNQVREFDMYITINNDIFPDWLKDGKLGVQLLFDENSYLEMERALNILQKTDDRRLNQLKSIIIGDEDASFEEKYKVSIPTLNKSQNDALNLVSKAQDLAIIHGPPGTGKTTTIIQSIVHTLKDEKQILVCAPSNSAVDLLVEKLSEKGINVLRIGHPARVTDNVLKNTLDTKVTLHEHYKDVKMIRKQAEELFKSAGKYKRNFGPEERRQRNESFKEARRLKDEAKQLIHYITSSLISDAQVIATTLVGANNYQIKDMKFKTVFIDEAAQGLEPATWIPIIRSDRVILAGDHSQLPPTVKSYEAAKNGLEITLFEKAIKRNSADVMLNEQYRMNEKIMTFSSRYFYKNQLIANEKVKIHTIFDEDIPVEFIDTAGTGFSEYTDPETKSTMNREEADLLMKYLKTYLEGINETNLTEIDGIGVISPYKAQVNILQEHFDNNFEFPDFVKEKVSINTVDSFQGQERDIIFISLVRSNEKNEIGFLADIRRMNVAMTRARKKLVIFGDSGTICKNNFYNSFVDYINEIAAYKSAFEIMY
ncbi:MAG: AAA family ATPase [Bacteroidales bacterium]|nr:AAA family ATPase [Bacteroidales bacterium]